MQFIHAGHIVQCTATACYSRVQNCRTFPYRSMNARFIKCMKKANFLIHYDYCAAQARGILLALFSQTKHGATDTSVNYV